MLRPKAFLIALAGLGPALGVTQAAEPPAVPPPEAVVPPGDAERSDPASVVDFNDPQAMRALQARNPAHYEKVQQIIEVVAAMPVESRDLPTVIRTRFDAADVDYSDILLVTYPPRKRLAFTLDDTRYQGIIVLTSFDVERVPLRLDE